MDGRGQVVLLGGYLSAGAQAQVHGAYITAVDGRVQWHIALAVVKRDH